ncbi:hypothetical protein FHG87_018259 [Trinorchestia longiramus]|nr:hypothetical protein FHG87_018259 [Trinorchestia longiramus]
MQPKSALLVCTLLGMIFTLAKSIVFVENSGFTRPLYRPVFINNTRWLPKDLKDVQTTFSLNHPQLCLRKCADTIWCHLWCHDGTTCVISRVMVCPNYQDPNSPDKKCYTSRRFNFATNALAFSSKSRPSSIDEDQSRVVEHLVDGVYGFKVEECHYSLSPEKGMGLKLMLAFSETSILSGNLRELPEKERLKLFVHQYLMKLGFLSSGTWKVPTFNFATLRSTDAIECDRLQRREKVSCIVGITNTCLVSLLSVAGQ